MKDNSGLEPTAVTVQELFSLVETGQPVYLLDVRTVPEFHDARLSFTDMLIPYDSISQYLKELPEDKSTPVYTFCRTGRRSDVAAHFLRMVGYRHVFNVTGGIVAWKEAGYPTVSGPTE